MLLFILDMSAESNDSNESKDLDLPEKQTLGKGKRARIPNKRYSDLTITSPKLNDEKPKSKSIENGESVLKENKDELDFAGFNSSSTASLKSFKTDSPTPAKKLKTVDLADPNFLKPFKYGWKRELVYRSTFDSTLKRNGDIYYYTPTGKKLRSMREVSENLKGRDLTLENFTFFKEPIGLNDPEKEIIRDAKVKAGAAPVKKATPKIQRPVRISSPKLASTPTTPVEVAKPKTQARTSMFKVYV